MAIVFMVGAVGVSGGAGLVGLAMTSSWFGGTPAPPKAVAPATKDNAVFEHWTMDDASLWSEGVYMEPNCTWWNGTVSYTSDLCSHFSLSRMASNSAGRATERAVKCAAHFQTECVISPEVGVGIPAAFIYDPEGSGMRMLIAPRIIYPGGTALSDEDATRHIRVQDPEEKTNGWITAFNHTIDVEYLPGGSRAPVSERLSGSDAYCVQLLRAAFVEECWKQLD
jgi:hypothetical protein